MQRAFVAIVVFAALFNFYGFAQAAQGEFSSGSNVQKAPEQQKTETSYEGWVKRHGLYVAVSAGIESDGRMTKTLLMRRVNANPALLRALQEVSKLGVWTFFGHEFGVVFGSIHVDFRATDNEIINFLKK